MKMINSPFIEDHLCAIYHNGLEELSALQLYDECRNTLIGLASFSGILKIDSMQLINSAVPVEDLFSLYRDQKLHLSLKEFLDTMTKTWQNDPIFDKT